jgi:hypothetical protein
MSDSVAFIAITFYVPNRRKRLYKIGDLADVEEARSIYHDSAPVRTVGRDPRPR